MEQVEKKTGNNPCGAVQYKHFVSLGYFCSVASELERIGLRNISLPFDWCISEFQGVVKAIDSKFEGFLAYSNLMQNRKYHHYYRDEYYNIYFFRDFDKYSPLSKQIKKVQKKYYIYCK